MCALTTQILGLYQKLCAYQATACEHYHSWYSKQTRWTARRDVLVKTLPTAE